MTSFPDFLEKLLAEDKIEQAIKNLYDAIVYYRQNTNNSADISTLKKQTILLSSRYKNLQSQILNNTIDSQTSALSKNQIVQSFLEIIDNLEDYTPFLNYIDTVPPIKETAWFVEEAEDEEEYDSLNEEEFICEHRSPIICWWENLSLEWKHIFREKMPIPIAPTETDLECLKDVEKLDISSNQKIHTLSPLIKLPHLKELYCGDTKIIDIEPIEHLKELEVFSFRYTSVRNMNPVRNLNKLRYLDCSNTLVQSLEPLNNSMNLDTLICTLTLVDSIKPLLKLKNLRRLNCENFQLNQEEVDLFKENHPKCRVNDWN